jgi:rod shape-determining protein MreC
MESFLNRYRNITVLLLVIFAQLALLAVQVKNDQDVRLIRVWTVTAVTPVARIIEGLRGGSIGVVRNYILLRDANSENRRLQAEVDRLKLDNIFLKNELNTADRARALQVFQAHTPSKTVAASVIGAGPGVNSKVVIVDRGSVSGVERGMAVVTPDGIVGKVIAAYPTASQVMLITDPDFAAGVISQKSQVRGTLKGQGTPMCKVDYVPLEEKVEPGEWYYTSGDDRIFPRGFPVGIARVVRNAQPFKEIYVEPSGLQRGVEDVLILIEGVHQVIPEALPAHQPVYIAPAPPAPQNSQAEPGAAAPGGPGSATGTEADKLRAQYKAIGDAQNHKFGEGLPGSKPPDFNLQLPGAGGLQPGAGGQQPGAGSRGPGAGGRPTTGAPPTAQPQGNGGSRPGTTGAPGAPVGQPLRQPGNTPVPTGPQNGPGRGAGATGGGAQGPGTGGRSTPNVPGAQPQGQPGKTAAPAGPQNAPGRAAGATGGGAQGPGTGGRSTPNVPAVQPQGQPGKTAAPAGPQNAPGRGAGATGATPGDPARKAPDSVRRSTQGTGPER